MLYYRNVVTISNFLKGGYTATWCSQKEDMVISCQLTTQTCTHSRGHVHIASAFRNTLFITQKYIFPYFKNTKVACHELFIS